MLAAMSWNKRRECAVEDILSKAILAYSWPARDSAMELLHQEEDNMHRSYRYFFSSFVLTAALAAPAAMQAAAKPQDNGRQEEHRRDDNDHRVYDRAHNDYHNWDDREDHSYRVYLTERHREYHPFAEIKEKEQRAYWNWRHSHPDHDHDGR